MKYSSKYIYKANLVEIKDNEKKIREVELTYSEKDDVFYPLDIMNVFFSLDTNPSLPLEERKKYIGIINENKLPYKNNDSCAKYIEEDSITIIYTLVNADNREDIKNRK